MTQRSDEELASLMENNPYDRGYRPIGRNGFEIRTSPNPKRKRKILLSVGAGVLILAAVFAISFRLVNSRYEEQFALLKANLDQIAGRLTRIEEMEDKIAMLEEQDKKLQHSLSVLQGSRDSLRGQLTKLSQNMGRLQKTFSVPEQKASTGTIQKPTDGKRNRFYHKVHPGDSLYGIAKKYGISVTSLCSANRITRDQIIRPGQRLLIPLGNR